MREQFEKLPEIKPKLISVRFNEGLNRYESVNSVLIECIETAIFINGAWYCFQEQQKIIESYRLVFKIQFGFDMAKGAFANGGYVKNGEQVHAGVVAPAEHYFIRDNIDQSMLEKINGLSKEMNATITIFSDATITKTGD